MDRRHMLLSSLGICLLGLSGCVSSSGERTPLLSLVRVGKVSVSTAGMKRESRAKAFGVSNAQVQKDLLQAMNARVVGLGTGAGHLDLSISVKEIRIASKAERLLAGSGYGSGFKSSLVGHGEYAGRKQQFLGVVNTAKSKYPQTDTQAEYSEIVAQFAEEVRELLSKETIEVTRVAG